MNQPPPDSLPERALALSGLPRVGAEPVFAEPWQAQAFALTIRLAQQGCFTWAEWTTALATQIRAGAAHDDGTQYYHHWVAALERLVIDKGLSNAAALAQRKQDWADAYRHTPHGQPVRLGA